MTHSPRDSSVAGTGPRNAGLFLFGVVLVLVAGGAYLLHRYRLNDPVVFESLEEHYLYGSVGGDVQRGLPLEVMRILPEAFREHLPPRAPPDYTAFGFVQEDGRPMPMGFSIRQHVVPRTGFNCAPCHVGGWRASPDEPSSVILGMPAVNLDIAAYFGFLFAVAEDPRFNPDFLIPLMEGDGAELGALNRLVYRFLVIPSMRSQLLRRKAQFEALFAQGRPPYGPGRVDTFNPYKLDQLAEHYPDGIPYDESFGTVAYPAIWNQGAREGHALNWDGNSPSIHDRNMGAAFGSGATRSSIDVEAIGRVTEYLRDLPPPPYPWGIGNREAQRRGQALYRTHCASCHALDGPRMGSIVPLDEIGTDPYRVQSYTDKLNRLLLDYGEGYPWQLTRMQNTNGYANHPLDGIWARAPYLHNGSVPTLWDLLTPEGERNGGQPTFYVGHGVYDTVDVGIRTKVSEIQGRPSFLFDARLPGNGNFGHSGPQFGTELEDHQKRDLLEYLRTL